MPPDTSGARDVSSIVPTRRKPRRVGHPRVVVQRWARPLKAAPFQNYFSKLSLLQAFDQVEICEGAVKAVDVGFSVGGDEDWSDGGYSGGIGGHEIFPGRALSGGWIESIDFRGNFAEAVNIEGGAVGGPADGLLGGFEAGDGGGIAAVDGIQITFLIGTDACDKASVRRNREVGSIHAFRGDGQGLAAVHVLNIEPHTVAGFASGKDKMLAVGQPARGVVINGIAGQSFRFACAGGQQAKLSREAGSLCDHPLLVGRQGRGCSLA